MSSILYNIVEIKTSILKSGAFSGFPCVLIRIVKPETHHSFLVDEKYILDSIDKYSYRPVVKFYGDGVTGSFLFPLLQKVKKMGFPILLQTEDILDIQSIFENVAAYEIVIDKKEKLNENTFPVKLIKMSDKLAHATIISLIFNISLELTVDNVIEFVNTLSKNISETIGGAEILCVIKNPGKIDETLDKIINSNKMENCILSMEL